MSVESEDCVEGNETLRGVGVWCANMCVYEPHIALCDVVNVLGLAWRHDGHYVILVL